MLRYSTVLYGAATWTLRQIHQDYLEGFWNVVSEKGRKAQLEWSCEK